MYRFIAFIWDPTDDRISSSAQMFSKRLRSSSSEWRCAQESDGLQVFHAGARAGATEAYRLQGSAGVVVGKLFRRLEHDGETPLESLFDRRASETIIQTKGKHLADQYWGRYIAFLCDKGNRAHYVFRDPTGGLPCIYTIASGVSIFMSDLEDYIPLAVGERSVNWNYVAALFWNLRLITRETGFEGVFRLHAGECRAIGHGPATSSFHWNPTEVYRAGPLLEEPDHARAALRSAVKGCVASWASCYDSIIHQLSGGLDSSIVASCLSETRTSQRIVCVNLSTEGKEGDELYFARLTAQKAGLELVEGRWRSSDRPLENMLDAGKHDTPFSLHSETDRLLQRLTLDIDAAAIFSGQGGDHLFQQQRSPLIAAEYAWRYGLRRPLAKIVADTSRLTAKSIWKIMGAMVAFGLLRREIDIYAVHEKSILLTDEVRTGLTYASISHPWINTAQGIPMSKVQQIRSIVDAQHFYLRPYQFADTLHPLISQPIIECCLRIPTYVLTRGGVPRALAREAFNEELAPEIVARTSKGGTTGYLNRLAVENTHFLREYLLDGILVSARILEKEELERQLSEKALVRGEHLLDIFTAVRTEAWLRSWASIWHKAAA